MVLHTIFHIKTRNRKDTPVQPLPTAVSALRLKPAATPRSRRRKNTVEQTEKKGKKQHEEAW